MKTLTPEQRQTYETTGYGDGPVALRAHRRPVIRYIALILWEAQHTRPRWLAVSAGRMLAGCETWRLAARLLARPGRRRSV
jgi:hypothetical protein